jgi:hypothetical protein
MTAIRTPVEGSPTDGLSYSRIRWERERLTGEWAAAEARQVTRLAAKQKGKEPAPETEE